MRSLLEVERYESGIPVETAWDRMVLRAQPVLTVAFAASTLAFVRPMAVVDGMSAGGLARLLLVVGCTALLLTIRVPDRFIPTSYRPWIATAIAVFAGALMGLSGQGWAATFAYLLAVHAGFQYSARTALRIIALCVFVAVLVSHTSIATSDSPWWTNLLVFAALIPGMTRRTRRMTLASANEVVVQSRRAAASEAQSRAMAERASIARDIHDVLAHSLSGVNMQLSLADALFESGDVAAGRDAVRTAQRLVVDGLQEARSAMQTLRGDTIDSAETIARMVTGPQESVTIVGEPQQLPSSVAHALVRVAQESLTNARRHAAGAPVVITMRYAPDEIQLAVINAAPPTDAATELTSTDGSGLGLVGIRERVDQVGGRADIGPDGAGWAVRVWIPLHAANDKQEVSGE